MGHTQGWRGMPKVRRVYFCVSNNVSNFVQEIDLMA